jgi:hypothetical protein
MDLCDLVSAREPLLGHGCPWTAQLGTEVTRCSTCKAFAYTLKSINTPPCILCSRIPELYSQIGKSQFLAQ